MPVLRLRTFGGLALEGAAGCNGATMQRKPLALLAIMAVAGQKGISRDLLVGLLWPESETERARNSLNQTLTRLRRDAGADELVLGASDLRLNPHAITSDVAEFEGALAAGEPERAAALYGGEFLEGIYLKNTPEFERWADRERHRLAHRAAAAVERLAAAAAEHGDKHAAASWWRRRVALEPTSTPATTALVHALIDVGDREGAIRQAQTYAALLRAELDAEPDPALMRLAEQLRAAPASVGDLVGSGRGADARSTVAEGGDAAAMPVVPAPAVMPAEAGIQGPSERLDSRLGRLPCIAGQPARGHDDQGDAGVRANYGERSARLRRRLTRAAAALATVAVISVTYAYIPRPRAESKLVIVPPFANQTGDSSLAAVGNMAADWVRQGLAQTGLVELVDVVDVRGVVPDAMRKTDSSTEAERWRAAARRAGAGMVVRGSVYKQRDTLVVHAQVVRASDGKILYEGEPVAASAADPRALLEPTRQHVMGALAALEDPRFARWQTVITQPPRYDAYEEFIAGVEDHNWGRLAESFRHFLNAARLDTSFAQAKLWIELTSWAQDDSLLALVAPSMTTDLARQRDRLSPYDRALLDYVTAADAFDHEGELIAARRLTELAPSDIGALVLHAQAARNANHFDEAMHELHRADVSRSWVREDVDYWSEELLVHHFAGDYTGQLAEAARCRKLAGAPAANVCDDMELSALLALGREASVDSLAAIQLASPKSRGVGPFYFGAGQEYRAHNYRDAERRAYTRARPWYEERARAHPARPETAPSVSALLTIDFSLGNWTALRDFWTQAMAAGHPVGGRGYAHLGLASAHLGDTATARVMLQRIDSMTMPPAWEKPILQAVVATALGEKARAMEFLLAAVRLGYSPITNGHWRPGLDALRGYPPYDELMRPRR